MGGDTGLALTPELEKLTSMFKAVPDAKLRYQQLLYFAKELAPMADELKTPANKVPGCLSTVYLSAKLDPDTRAVSYVADSDAQLTKGLAALLLRGVNGCTPEEIAAIDPAFITESGLSVSLTPGRNNGFLNMLALVKSKAVALGAAADAGAAVVTSRDMPTADGGAPPPSGTDAATGAAVSAAAVEDDEEPEDPAAPVASAIRRKLRTLRPASLVVTDNSAAHAGHAGARGLNGESHFKVSVVADAFDGLSAVKRHQVIYALLKDEMAGPIHALEIEARSVAEVASRT
ncbi:hypothetical protein MMPV_001224 [Pyropia vietnamensis]